MKVEKGILGVERFNRDELGTQEIRSNERRLSEVKELWEPD